MAITNGIREDKVYRDPEIRVEDFIQEPVLGGASGSASGVHLGGASSSQARPSGQGCGPSIEEAFRALTDKVEAGFKAIHERLDALTQDIKNRSRSRSSSRSRSHSPVA